ncbi:hypothetical protein R5R35_000290 [Gryllus longicercus]|uniref:Sm domain-containing protein n=1 Tax=Gryllus longicercus TaxID=2509291 RepID=A0AAN9V9B0_9ORTH
MSASKREKFYSYNTLVCLIEGLEGKYTTVDMRNESFVYGKIMQADGFMNLVMSDVTYVDGRGSEYNFDSFFVHARNIRYIHIPTELSIIQTINEQLQKMKRTVKPERQQVSKKVLQRHTETLKMIYGDTK